ncbi:MAG: beta-ketoacyl-[acyl-carrier-protein] synthase family protein [Elusimicrobiota bacterium]|jgi:3-oxoacyl-(acyl-carrier-protein) synthase|nr:beta-ketoacyl-[acyl-carrier-protein] synthase family protein [Elusimicrobiota bacterium]
MKIYISGIGCVCALGENIKEISKNLFEQNIEPSFPISRLKSSFEREYPVFQVSQDILKQKKDDESFSFLFLRKALDEALENAALSAADLKKYRVGVCIGTSVDASFKCFDLYKSWKQKEPVSNSLLDKYLNYSISQNVLDYLEIKGISQTIVTACASGTDAVGICSKWIESGLCDIGIAGGADEIDLIPYTGFIKLMLASKESCKPFDKNRKGINLGEGAGVFILSGKDNGKNCGTVLGYGNASDGYHNTSPHPEGRGLKKALLSALKESGAQIEEIAFINAHGTASVDNDAAEAKVFNALLKDIPVCATKGLTGHCLGAAGAVEAVLSQISLHCRKIPKTKNFKEADANLHLIPALENTDIEKNIALSDSLSFGGCNSVLVLGGKI